MTLKEHYEKAVEYVKQNVDEVDIMLAWRNMDLYRCPLYMAHESLAQFIMEMMDEYGEDNELPEDWWREFGDEEDVFDKF